MLTTHVAENSELGKIAWALARHKQHALVVHSHMSDYVVCGLSVTTVNLFVIINRLTALT